MNFLENWLAYWVDLLESIVGILTFTLYNPRWSLDFRVWWFKTFIYGKGKKNSAFFQAFFDRMSKPEGHNDGTTISNRIIEDTIITDPAYFPTNKE